LRRDVPEGSRAMAKPFDATLKELVETYPRDWLAQLGLPSDQPVEVIDADLSTITTQADKLLRLQEPTPSLLHLELQASRDPRLARRILKHNVLAHDRHDLPVQSIVVLLRPEADAPDLTGTVQYKPPHGGSLEFEFDVVRLWQQPVERLLSGGLGTLPLAPLGDVEPAALPAVIQKLDERFSDEAPPGEAATLWASTYILMGLRFPAETVSRLVQGVSGMRESSTYQSILSEEAKKLVLRLGTRRFGAPDHRTQTTLDEISSVERLEQLAERLLDVSGWDELLAST
jgi:predicted transposase YdaD